MIKKLIPISISIIFVFLLTFSIFTIFFSTPAKSSSDNLSKIHIMKIHDTLYKEKLKIRLDSFTRYVQKRDTILISPKKIDSVYIEKIDSTSKKDSLNIVKKKAIDLKDSLTLIGSNLDDCQEEVNYKDSLITSDTIKTDKKPWGLIVSTTSAALALGLLIGIIK